MPDPAPASVPFGPDNPHSLSTMRTELVWEGKYDEYGRRRAVDVAGSALPLEKLETVDMPRREGLASRPSTWGRISRCRWRLGKVTKMLIKISLSWRWWRIGICGEGVQILTCI